MKKTILILAVVSTCVFAGWRVLRGGDSATAPSDGDDEGLMLNRLWVDHMPKHERDTINVFAAITQDPIGIFQTASVYKGQYELFTHETHRGEMRIVYPQNGERERVKTKSHRCSKGGFDYCLEIKGASRGVKHY
jgi:hypothetical protein